MKIRFFAITAIIALSFASASQNALAQSETTKAPQAPTFGIAPSSLDFGAQLVGTTSSPQTVTITNDDAVDLIFETITVSGDFALLSNDTCSGKSITTSQTCTFDITFSPLSNGLKSGSVTIPSNSATLPDSIALTGTGISLSVEIAPISINFGNQAIGAISNTQTVTVTNTGTADLVIEPLTPLGEFTLNPDLCSGQIIVPAATCTFSVAFSPLSVGAKSGSVSISSNATSSPDVLSLSGTGVDANTWFVATTGDDLNDCITKNTPCLSINGAIKKAASGDVIYIANGTYTGAGGQVVLINKSITLSGGWNADFSSQNGRSTIDGQTKRRGMVVNDGFIVFVDRLRIRNGFNSAFGGGVYNSGNLTISNSIINNNVSRWMGGGMINYGTLTVNNTTISENRTGAGGSGGGGGGGIQDSGGTTTLNNSTVSDNTIIGSYDGAGINASGTVILNNSTVSGNTGGTGDGIFTFVGTVMLNNSTISNNQVRGITNLAGSVTLKNTIIAGNGSNSDCYNDTGYNGKVISNGYNLIGVVTGCAIKANIGDQFGSKTDPINPFLGPLQNNGGSTNTHALFGGSPAIDGGNPSAPGSGDGACLANDQRGILRPEGSTCDIGAFEGHITVVSSVERSNPSPTGADKIRFKITFSEPVTGVDTISPFDDFSLTTNGMTGASISAVSGIGNVYVVTVQAGVGDGSIGLNVVDNDSILDASGYPLGGVGIGNGDFTSGESYTIWLPRVTAITRINANPTSSSTVKYKVTFSEEVEGVDTGDFILSTTGVTGASISSISGAGKTYTITAKTGKGNGSARLDLTDDDSIKDVSANPIGGIGLGNGNFTTGQRYTIQKIPNPQAPVGTITDATPTYQWAKTPNATKYRYQVVQNENPIFEKIVDLNACGTTTCSDTPNSKLNNGAYKWGVQAMFNGIWKDYSAYKSFNVNVPPPPKAGFWNGSSPEYSEFYVAIDKANIDNFAIYVTVYECEINNQKFTYDPLTPIVNNHFSHNGPFYFSGTFTSATSANGVFGMDYYYWPGCGYIHGGPFHWNNLWRNYSQPLILETNTEFTITPALDTPLDYFSHFDLLTP